MMMPLMDPNQLWVARCTERRKRGFMIALLFLAGAVGGCGRTSDTGLATDPGQADSSSRANNAVAPGSGASPTDIVRESVRNASNADSVKWRMDQGADVADIEVSRKDGVWYQKATFSGVQTEVMRTDDYELLRGDEGLVRVAHDSGHPNATNETWFFNGAMSGEGIAEVLTAGLKYPVQVNIFPPESVTTAVEIGREPFEGGTLHEYAVTIDADEFVRSTTALFPDAAANTPNEDDFHGTVPLDVHVWVDEEGTLQKAAFDKSDPNFAGRATLDSLKYNEQLSVGVPPEGEIVHLEN